jgi:hypothetical protein
MPRPLRFGARIVEVLQEDLSGTSGEAVLFDLGLLRPPDLRHSPPALLLDID